MHIRSLPQAPVQFEAVQSLRKITLNRPKAFNALSAEMVDLIQPALEVRCCSIKLSRKLTLTPRRRLVEVRSV